MQGEIFVFDSPTFGSAVCGCGSEAGFVVGIHGQVSQLCAECLANVAKKIIDGLT